MTSGKGDRDDEEEEKGKRMYLMEKEDSMKDRNSMKSREWRFSDQNQWRFYGSSGMTARAVSGALTLTLTLAHTETHSQLVLVLILQPHFPPENNDLIMIMQCLKLRGLNLFSHRYIRWHVLMGGINPEQSTLLVQHFTPGCKHRSATQNYVAIVLMCVVQNIPRLQHKLTHVAQLILTKPKESFVLTYCSPWGCKSDSITFVLWAFRLSALNY